MDLLTCCLDGVQGILVQNFGLFSQGSSLCHVHQEDLSQPHAMRILGPERHAKYYIKQCNSIMPAGL